MTAYEELLKYLKDGEEVKGLVFGGWGGDRPTELGYGETKPWVPFNLRGKLMTLKEAEPYMQHWKFSGGYGAPECYATYIWTNKRVLWVTQYDGATGLDSAPRSPRACMPEMPGGG